MFYRPIVLAAMVAATLPTHAAISVDSTAFSYLQNFDTLTTSTSPAPGPWTNDVTLDGWSLFMSTGEAVTTYLGGSGQFGSGSFYSFGATGSTDRALGGIGSGNSYFGTVASGAVAGYIAVSFTNNTGAALSSFTLGFDGEQWRKGGNSPAQTMVLEYGLGSTFADVTTWTAPGGNFDWASPVIGGSSAAVDGNTAGLVAGRGGSVATSWAAGTTLWVRWIENNDVGNNHGLGIDNLTLTVSAVPEPGTYAMFLTGLAAITCIARRRA